MSGGFGEAGRRGQEVSSAGSGGGGHQLVYSRTTVGMGIVFAKDVLIAYMYVPLNYS